VVLGAGTYYDATILEVASSTSDRTFEFKIKNTDTTSAHEASGFMLLAIE